MKYVSHNFSNADFEVIRDKKKTRGIVWNNGAISVRLFPIFLVVLFLVLIFCMELFKVNADGKTIYTEKIYVNFDAPEPYFEVQRNEGVYRKEIGKQNRDRICHMKDKKQKISKDTDCFVRRREMSRDVFCIIDEILNDNDLPFEKVK